MTTPAITTWLMILFVVCWTLPVRFRALGQNGMTLLALMVGIMLNGCCYGSDGVVSAMGGIGVALGAWTLGAMCGVKASSRDLKLLAAAGALGGAPLALSTLAVAVSLAGAAAVLQAARQPLTGPSPGPRRSVGDKVNSALPLQPETRQLRLALAGVLPLAVGVLGMLFADPSARMGGKAVR